MIRSLISEEDLAAWIAYFKGAMQAEADAAAMVTALQANDTLVEVLSECPAEHIQESVCCILEHALQVLGANHAITRSVFTMLLDQVPFCHPHLSCAYTCTCASQLHPHLPLHLSCRSSAAAPQLSLLSCRSSAAPPQLPSSAASPQLPLLSCTREMTGCVAAE